MKKNYFALAAIVLAVAASAFTAKPKVDASKPFATRYYWNFNTGSLGAFQGAFATHADAKTATGCPDIVTQDCSRGYLQTQLVNPALPGSSTNPPSAAQQGSPNDRLLKN